MNLWLTQAKSGRMHNHTTQKSDSYVKLTASSSKNKRAQRALDRSPETKDFKFPFFIALSTTGDTWQSKS